MQKATVGGTLCIIGSILGAFGSILFLAMPYLLSVSGQGAGLDADSLGFVGVLYTALGVVGLILGGLGLVGGIFAVRHKTFGLALAGAVASSIIFYPLGIAAVILISMGHQEFKTAAPQTAFYAPPPGTPPAAP
jgi:hypothetical protein